MSKMQTTLVYNAIQTPDGTVLESHHRHDYRDHLDANGKTYMVDGGTSYLRRSVHDDQIELSLTDLSDISEIREKMTWGTYGKNGDQPRKEVRLKDLTNPHIEAILETQKQLSDDILHVFRRELVYREINDLNIPEDEL
jgi:hypothetical protein